MLINTDTPTSEIAARLRELASELETSRAEDPVHLARVGTAIHHAGMVTCNKAYLCLGRQKS